jgi:hypothetical protein
MTVSNRGKGVNAEEERVLKATQKGGSFRSVERPWTTQHIAEAKECIEGKVQRQNTQIKLGPGHSNQCVIETQGLERGDSFSPHVEGAVRVQEAKPKTTTDFRTKT